MRRPPPPEHERARLALQIEPEHDEPPRRRRCCVSLPCALVSLGTLVVTASAAVLFFSVDELTAAPQQFASPQNRRPGYDEIIVDAVHWRQHLPDVIECFVNSPDAHAAFLNEFGLSARTHPHIRLSSNWDAPFSE